MKKIVILTALTLLIFITCKKAIEKPVSNDTNIVPETVVKTAPIEHSIDNPIIESLGIVISNSDAKPAFKTGGVIEKTYVKEGDQVIQGQILARLIMTEIDAQVMQAEQAKQKSERDLQRIKNLYQDTVATLEQWQNANTAFEMSKQNIQIAEFNRTHSICRAPISGKILKQIMHSGEMAAPGMPIYAIVGTKNEDWRIRISLIDRDWAKTNIGDSAKIKFDAFPNMEFNGTISNKSFVTTHSSGTLDLEIKISNPNSNLAVGLTAKTVITTKAKNKITTIPIESLVKSSGKNATVFTIENGLAKKLEIEISEIIGERVSVQSGLENINEIVTTGSVYLEAGDKVRKAN